jgi:aspartyl protease family protein
VTPAARRAEAGTVTILLFWVTLFVVVAIAMHAYFGPKVARARGDGTVEIERSRDGHYYVAGAVNGVPVVFMVDTGASTVVVGGRIGAALGQGTPVQMNTAGGHVVAEVTRDNTVSAGGITVEGLRVAVIANLRGSDALLGQNFLRHVEVTTARDRMMLRIPEH